MTQFPKMGKFHVLDRIKSLISLNSRVAFVVFSNDITVVCNIKIKS